MRRTEDMRGFVTYPGSEPEAVEAVHNFATHTFAIKCVGALAGLGVADALNDEPESPERLAEIVGAHPDALRRALRFVATYGVFTEGSDGRFSHSVMSRVLRADHPQSQRDWLLLGTTKLHYGILASMDHSLRTGRPAAEIAAPEGIFNYLAKHPDEAAMFDRAMTSKALTEIPAVCRACDFSRFKMIADIGGGRGHLLKAVLSDVPDARGVLFDLPHVANAAGEGVSERIRVLAGDFFKDRLPVCDAYLLKNVIHDWGDGESIAILKAVRRVAPANSVLMIIEAELPAGPEPHPAKALNWIMLGYTSGRERTAAEYEALLSAAAFKLERVIRASKEVAIFEAIPIGAA